MPDTVFTCRDRYESKKKMPNALFCHDMAFYLGPIPFNEGNGTGYFFRRDIESSGKIDIPKTNNDISKKGNYLSEGVTFLKEIAKYSIVHTDRLHVAIAACLLNSELHFYPGLYFKNQAVYRSSIDPYFDNITFYDVKTTSKSKSS